MAKDSVRLILPLWKKLSFTVAILVPALLVMELVMGLLGYYPAKGEWVIRRDPPNATAEDAAAKTELPQETCGPDAFQCFAVCDRRFGFRNRPNGSFRSPHIEGNPVSTTDEFGYRSGFEWPGDGESPIVLFIGDSITFCSEVNDEETAPSEVAKLLSKEFQVRVLNAGVRAFNTLQSKRMLLECLDRFPRTKVAVYTYCGNDLEENMVANYHFPAKAPVMTRDGSTGRFREVEVLEPAVPWNESFLKWRPPPPPPPGIDDQVVQWLDTHSALWHNSWKGLSRLDLRFERSLRLPTREDIPVSRLTSGTFGRWKTVATRSSSSCWRR